MAGINPKVGLIVPAFNAGPYIGRCLESVICQGDLVAEIVVVDDGSTDGTAAAVELAKDTDHRIRLIRQENQGISGARNAGIRALADDIDVVMFLDQDDELINGALSHLTSALQANPNAVAVFGRAIAINSSGNQLEPHRPWGGTRQYYRRFRIYIKENLGNITPDDLLCANCIFSPGQALIRRECLATIGGFDQKVTPSEDWDLWFQLSKLGSIYGIDVPILRYRLHSSNFSANRRRMQIAGLRLRWKWVKEATPRLKLRILVAYMYRLLDRSGFGLLSSSRQ